MADSTQQQLKHAYELIKNQQRQAAIDILLPILNADQENANAWWLMANAVTDPNDAREALQHVLRLRPDNDKAQQMLARINALHPPAPEPEPEPEPDDIFDFGDSDDFEEDAPADLADMVNAPPEPTADESAAWDDPFGAPQPTSASSDPFGGPAQSFGAPSPGAQPDTDPFGAPSTSAADDPFGAPPPQPARPARDPFGGDDDPFAADAPPRKSRSEGDPFGGSVGSSMDRVRSSAGNNRTLWIVLGVVVFVLVCGCIACFAVAQAGVLGAGVFVDTIVNEFDENAVATLQAVGVDMEGLSGTLQAGGGEAIVTLAAAAGDFSFGEGDLGAPLPANVVQRGSLNYGDTRQDTLAANQQHGYTFTGSAGDTVVITLDATASDPGGLDPVLELYGPENRLVASNDDFADGSLNSRVEFQLPTAGTYTIVAKGFFGSGGGYALSLTRR